MKAQTRDGKWLNRNVFGFGLTSLLGDYCHEMATAVLPQFMQAIGSSAAALGFIEGVADALSSFVKIGAGYYSDKAGRRKALSVAGYFLTATAKFLFAFAFAWPLILLGRAVGWLGRGLRGPLRDAMLADSVAPGNRGKAFGFHRAGDTAGAVLGPITAYAILTWASGHPTLVSHVNSWLPAGAAAQGGVFRMIFLLTLIPGLLSVLSMAFLITENRRPRAHEMRFMTTLRGMPPNYRQFLWGVGLFGFADFAPTLMILRVTTVMEPTMGLLNASRWATLLYLVRNIVYALASYPIGALSDRFSRPRYLATGYALAVATFVGFAVARPSIFWFAVCFVLAGLYIAWEDTIEGVAVRDYVPESVSGTAYGVLGAVNGVGDFAASLIVGTLWTALGPGWGFAYAAIVGTAGAICMARAGRTSASPRPSSPRRSEKSAS